MCRNKLISYTACTHSWSCLAPPLAQTFVCLCLCANELFAHVWMFVHVNANEPFSPFVLFGLCSKTASRSSATNGEANEATNDEANMWLVHSSFASPLAWMCKCGRECVNAVLHDLTLKFIKKELSIKAFSWINETSHKYFPQIEVEEERSNYLLP